MSFKQNTVLLSLLLLLFFQINGNMWFRGSWKITI